MNIPPLDYINLVSALVSLILGIIAIWLSLYFYTKSKDSERRVDSALTGIKTQTDMLNRLHTRVLDKYTTYATNPKPADEVVVMLAQMLDIRSSAGINTSPPPELIEANESLSATVVEMYIASMFYAGNTNILSQSYLPGDISETVEEASWVKQMVDQSVSDYNLAKQWIEQYASERAEVSRLGAMYHEGLQLSSLIKDTTSVYADRAIIS